MELEKFFEINKDGSDGAEAWANLETTTLEDIVDWHKTFNEEREKVQHMWDFFAASDDGSDYCAAACAANKEVRDDAEAQLKEAGDDPEEGCIEVEGDEAFDYVGWDRVEELTGVEGADWIQAQLDKVSS